MIDKAPILITGIPRSGASMIAQAIHICGAFGGVMSNKRGMFENDRIRDTVIKSYLNLIGVDDQGQFPLTGHLEHPWIPSDFRQRVDGVMESEGYKKGLWMYKDSRIPLMYRVWQYAYPDAKLIIVRRRTGDITQSCIKTAYMNAYKVGGRGLVNQTLTEEEGWLQMVHKYEELFIEIINSGVNCKVVWPERMMYGDYKQLYETLDWVGLTWRSEILNVIDPLFLSSRQKERR